MSPMADVLAPLLKKLLRLTDDSDSWMYGPLTKEAQDSKSKVAYYFDVLMQNLWSMMGGYDSMELHDLFTEIEREVARIDDHSILGLSWSDRILETCEKFCNMRYGSNVEGEEIVVGLDDEVETLLDQLTATSTKQLQIISITGMPGLGKTTLARKLYNHPLIEYVYDIRAWTYVSQVYVKRDLLLGILSSFINDLTEEIYNMSDEQLGGKLYRLLKGRKYLVVLDDIWDVMAWNDLKIYFPDDKVGSRALFTSRDTDISLHVGAARPSHVLRLRTEDESWAIFLMKVFRTGICLHRLQEFGRQITRNCKGLPLAIVIIAGLLNNQLSDTWWKQIAESQHSFRVRDPSQYMDSLSLSYNHLPRELKRCFLFLSVFPEDYDIPVTKLMWLWVAQGCIHEPRRRILEDVAEDFLMDLIKRSLLMTSKRRADGHIKACRIHDLLRDLCLKKAEEERSDPIFNGYAPDVESSSTFPDTTLLGMSLNRHELYPGSGLYSYASVQDSSSKSSYVRASGKRMRSVLSLHSGLYIYAPVPESSNTVQMNRSIGNSLNRPAISPHHGLYSYAPASESSSSITNMVHVMPLNPSSLSPHSGMCYPYECGAKLLQDGYIPFERYYFLRILDVESVHTPVFPNVVILVNLRYLAIQAYDGRPPTSISYLGNLKMLIILSEKNIVLPTTIWNMINLRHLYLKSKSGENHIQEQVTENDVSPSRLDSLQTLSRVCPQYCQNIFLRTPNLRNLGFCRPLVSSQGDIEFPNICSLDKLQKLKLFNTVYHAKPTRLLNATMFPKNLKKLTLSNTGMDWEDMGTLSLLRNLEVLKLKFHACIGEKWETTNEKFQRLKTLQLHGLNLRQWVCSRDNFPCLQRLVIRHCSNLNSIPTDLGRIRTLEAIEVQGCKKSVHVSALKIQEEQEGDGNCFLKVHAANNYS